MSKWNARNLFVLAFVFVGTLVIFNAGALLHGPIADLIPFTPSDRGYILRVTNLSLLNAPLAVEAHPRIKMKGFMSVWCGDESGINERKVQLAERFSIGLLSICKTITIEVWPRHNNIGLWLHGYHKGAYLWVTLLRLSFMGIIGGSFYFLYQHKKHHSAMRSVLITQISCIIILDPLYPLVFFMPALEFMHQIVSAVGWWRAAVEIFTEYGPLTKKRNSFYRGFSAFPAFILGLCTVSDRMTHYSFRKPLMAVGAIGCVFLLAEMIWFLRTTSNMNGRTALVIHLISGTLSLSVVYITKVLRMFSDDFQNSLFSSALEISFTGAYALFQTIFKAGEGSSSTQEKKPSAVFKTTTYGNIDEMLKVIHGADDEPVFGDLPPEEEEDLDYSGDEI